MTEVSEGIYDGPYDEVRSLFQGYWDYAQEVVTNRAIPDVRDGLKPVHRHILYGMWKEGNKFWSSKKSASVVGVVMPYHMHGDASVYEAASKMTTNNRRWVFPPLEAQGNLGDIYGNPPASARYTHMWLGENAKEFFDHMDGVTYKIGESEMEEPEYLPVRFPLGLLISQTGLAVGMSANIPGYNFWDVLEMTESVIKGETLLYKTYAPDVYSGGMIINDPEQFQKIIATGKGMLTLRSNVVINGNTIHALTLPPDKSVEGIRTQLNKFMDKNDPGYIPDLVDHDDNMDKNGMNLSIICKRGTAETVLMELYRRSILQQNTRVNLLYANNGVPLFGGVEKIIRAWQAGREQVLTKSFNKDIANQEEIIKKLSWLLQLIDNEPARDKYVDILVHSTIPEATEYLKSVLEGIPDDVAKWMSGLRAVEFNKSSKYRDEYNKAVDIKKQHEYYLEHMDEYLLNDLAELRAKYAGQFPRRTEVTNTVYKFKKPTKNALPESASAMWVTVTDKGMLYKTENQIKRNGIIYQEVVNSNDTLAGFDNLGQVMKVYLSGIPASEKVGYKLQDYLGINQPDWRVVYISKLDGEDRILLFDDGYASTWNTSDLLDVRRKLLKNGVSPFVGKHLFNIFRREELPDAVLAMDDTNPSKMKFGWARVSEIRATKSSSAKVSWITGGTITGIGGGAIADLDPLIPNLERHHHKMSYSSLIDGETVQALMQRSPYITER